MSEKYIPSSSSAASMVANLLDYARYEYSLPGYWSSRLFYRDLKEDPVLSKRLLAETLRKANEAPMSYLEFYKITRGHEREPQKMTKDIQEGIFHLFERGSIMLYFEDYLMEIMDRELTELDSIVTQYIHVMGGVEIGQWDSLVANIGACCYQFFCREPVLYASLFYRADTNLPEEMSDQELLDGLGLKLSPNKYLNKISIHDNRSELIRRYQNKIESHV